MTNCHYKRLESLSFKELQLFGCSHLFPHAPYPQRNSERNWALSEEQRREEQLPPPSPTPPPPSPPSRPPPLQKPLFLTPCRVLLKHSPLLFPWPGLLKQHALHEKKRLVFKCYILKGGFFKVGAAICSDRSGLSPRPPPPPTTLTLFFSITQHY